MPVPEVILRPIRITAMAAFGVIVIGAAVLNARTDDGEFGYAVWFAATILSLFLVITYAVVRCVIYVAVESDERRSIRFGNATLLLHASAA